MDALETTFLELKGLAEHVDETPSSMFDRRFAALSYLYSQSNWEQRTELRALAVGSSALFWTCSVRCAEAAMMTRDAEWAFHAVVAHSIEDFRTDPRENQIRLALAWHAALRLGSDPKGLFTQVSDLSSDAASTALREFIERPAALKTLRALGCELISEGTRLRFRPIPPPWRR